MKKRNNTIKWAPLEGSLCSTGGQRGTGPAGPPAPAKTPTTWSRFSLIWSPNQLARADQTFGSGCCRLKTAICTLLYNSRTESFLVSISTTRRESTRTLATAPFNKEAGFTKRSVYGSPAGSAYPTQRTTAHPTISSAPPELSAATRKRTTKVNADDKRTSRSSIIILGGATTPVCGIDNLLANCLHEGSRRGSLTARGARRL